MSREKQIDFGRYKPLENGNIFDVVKNKFVGGSCTRLGYYIVSLKCEDGEYRCFDRHRVIWYYYGGDIPNGMHVDHIDGNKLNNSIFNLRCVTPYDNVHNPNTYKSHLSDEQKKKIGEANKGKKRTDETRKKISQNMKQRAATDEFKNWVKRTVVKNKEKSSKPVIMRDITGCTLAEFSSAKEAERITGILHIGECANGIRKTAGGHLWEWKN